MDKKDLYYTHDHEWVDFRGSVAYVGVCAFKLKGIKHVQQIEFEINNGFKKCGEVLATVLSEDYSIPIHMPVEGKILNLNELLLKDGYDILLQQPEQNGWVALIVPSSPYDRYGLLMPEQYKMNKMRKSHS